MSLNEHKPIASPPVWEKFDDGNWEDLRFPVQGINPAGQATAPTIDTADGTFLFSASAVNGIAGVAQFPHSWEIGTVVHPHIHWCPVTTNTGNILWRFYYEIKNRNNGSVYTGYTSTDFLVASSGVVGAHLTASFGEIDMTGLVESSIMKWKIERIGNDVSDTCTGEARLLEFDIHYRTGKIGTKTEFH